MILDLALLVVLVLTAVWTVMTARLMRSAIGLSLVSVMVSVIMFRFASPMAAVFELSVCAALISVIFMTTVSFTQRLDRDSLKARRRAMRKRFWPLPVLLLLAGAWLLASPVVFERPHAPVGPGLEVRDVLWHVRTLDLLGQIVVLLAGAFGVTALFKEWKGK